MAAIMKVVCESNLGKIERTPKVFMDGIPIKRVKSAKSLGVYIDERLSWADHIDYLSKRISSAIAGLRQVRPLFHSKQQ